MEKFVKGAAKMGKKIDKLKDVLTTLMGEEVTHDGKIKLTYKLALVLELSAAKADPLKALVVNDVGRKIYKSEDEIELSDAEYDVVKEIVKSNPAGFFAPIFAQIYQKVS